MNSAPLVRCRFSVLDMFTHLLKIRFTSTRTGHLSVVNMTMPGENPQSTLVVTAIVVRDLHRLYLVELVLLESDHHGQKNRFADDSCVLMHVCFDAQI